MMRLCHASIWVLACLGVNAVSASDSDLYTLMEQTEIRDNIRNKNESALSDESIAVEKAKIQTRYRPEYGMELRPAVSDDDVGLALRIYLPDRWSKKQLQEQLVLVARSEQMRVAALEWKDIVSVYREFCSYRKLKKQIALVDGELQYIEPYLKQADQSVELRQLALRDRTRLYSDYLNLMNDQHNLQQSLLEVEERLFMLLGPDSNLEVLSKNAVVPMPSQLEIQTLLRTALQQRPDYRQLGIDVQSMQLAQAAARAEEGFRLKYIQPAYRVDHGDGTDGWALSASFVLPWGTRNSDLAVYQNQQVLYLAAQDQQERIIESRLRTLLNTAEKYNSQHARQQQEVNPIIDQLRADLEQMGEVPIAQIRDVLSIRERIMDAVLQASEMDWRKETLAVDLTEELGGM